MKQTKARKIYKKQFGQQNHFLITSLIGLDLIEKYDVTCPESFSTSWNPKDKQRSARRSRDFQLNSFLSFAVDGIDMYISLINRAPRYIQDDRFSEMLSAAGRSVYHKVKNISDYLNIDKKYTYLVLTLISYRNNIIHSMAENCVEEKHEQVLLGNKEWIKENFRGLDIERLLSKLEEKKSPLFKEVASLINASHIFVEKIDSKIIEQIDESFYFKNLIRFLKSDDSSRLKFLRSDERQKRRYVSNYFENAFGIPQDEIDNSILNKLCGIDNMQINGTMD